MLPSTLKRPLLPPKNPETVIYHKPLLLQRLFMLFNLIFQVRLGLEYICESPITTICSCCLWSRQESASGLIMLKQTGAKKYTIYTINHAKIFQLEPQNINIETWKCA